MVFSCTQPRAHRILITYSSVSQSLALNQLMCTLVDPMQRLLKTAFHLFQPSSTAAAPRVLLGYLVAPEIASANHLHMLWREFFWPQRFKHFTRGAP